MRNGHEEDLTTYHAMDSFDGECASLDSTRSQLLALLRASIRPTI